MDSEVLTFDAETHTYRVGDERLPSVTQVLGDVGLARFGGPPGAGFQRGSAVHEACRLLDQGRLDRSTLDDRIVGYVQGWEAFRAATTDIKYDIIETPCWHPIYRYAGTPDRAGVGKCNDGTWRPVVIDIKTGGPAPWHHVQTAAYALALGTMPVARRGGVYLTADGRFKYVEHSDPNDGTIFLEALSIFRWRRNHGMKEGQQ